MMEWIQNQEEFYIILYGLILLWINIGYLKDYKKIKAGLEGISSEEELQLNPNSLSLTILALIFNFFRRWLMYLLAVMMTGSLFVTAISVVLFVGGLYDSLFNYSLARVRDSKIGLYLAIADIFYVAIFIVYVVLTW
ncbi:hypothetical protein EQV77_06485 [Halobacillus fulvus]|nr:hypothetical protein EQV77_06485 [Halobacillus fulvus]